MLNLKKVLLLIAVGKIQASLFDLNAIGEKEDFDMPNIINLNNSSRDIGTAPETLVTSTAFIISSTTSSIHSDAANPNPLAFGALFSTPFDAAVSEPLMSTSPRMSAPTNMRCNPILTDETSFASSCIRPAKRIKNEGHISLTDFEKYIQAEISFNAFKKNDKKGALRIAVEFIANNDYEGFLAFEPYFEAAFRQKYHLIKRMIHYIIRFGATNFLDSFVYTYRPAARDPNIEVAFEHLIATQSLDVLFMFLDKCRHLNNNNVMKAISRAVQKRYPGLHYLDYTVFEAEFSETFSIHYDKALKIYNAKTEAEKLNHLTDLISFTKNGFYISSGHFSQDRFLEIPFRYEEYFMSLEIEYKYHIAKLAVKKGDLDKLTRIIELVPDLAIHNENGNLFTFDAQHEKSHILRFFMEIVPEFVDLEIEKCSSPLVLSLKNESIENLKVFEASEVNFTGEIRFQGELVTPIRLAFELKKPKTLNFLLKKFGAANILDHLLQIYGSRNEIMTNAMTQQPNNDIITILRDKLGFDLNDIYTYGGKTGNAMIFFDRDDYSYREFKLKFGL